MNHLAPLESLVSGDPRIWSPSVSQEMVSGEEPGDHQEYHKMTPSTTRIGFTAGHNKQCVGPLATWSPLQYFNIPHHTMDLHQGTLSNTINHGTTHRYLTHDNTTQHHTPPQTQYTTNTMTHVPTLAPRNTSEPD